jgi:hypothetical protein
MPPQFRHRIPDEAIVLRGGKMLDHQSAIISAEDAETDPNERIYGLSVECFVVPTLDEAVRATRRPNKHVRLTTASRVRAASMDVIPTFDAPHATLRVPKPLNEDVWNELQRVFDAPIQNKYAAARRSS